MKYFLLLVIIFGIRLNAQTILNFDKRFVQSEDKWVAFESEKDSSHTYGFIYIDEQAGLTLNYEGTFKILSTGEFVPAKFDSTSIKVRLEPNNVLVAFIPDSKFQELNISAVPEWLKYYKTDTNSVARLYRWGYMYNGWNECAKALTYLVRAKQLTPNYEGLNVELAFSYNCLNQFDKAEQILVEEIKVNPTNAYVNKEYIYTLTKNKKIDIAANQFYKSTQLIKDNQYNAENCYNILYVYYIAKDLENFNKWHSELLKWPNSNKMINTYVERMKNDLLK